MGEGAAASLFMGEFQHSIDEKGRLTLPSRFREGLGESFIITKGLDNCLFVYPLEEWRNLEARLRSLPATQSGTRAFVRLFFSGAAECSVDRQGRVLLPGGLREYARIQRECVVIGVSSRVEIWAREEWERYVREAEHSYASVAEQVVDLPL